MCVQGAGHSEDVFSWYEIIFDEMRLYEAFHGVYQAALCPVCWCRLKPIKNPENVSCDCVTRATGPNQRKVIQKENKIISQHQYHWNTPRTMLNVICMFPSPDMGRSPPLNVHVLCSPRCKQFIFRPMVHCQEPGNSGNGSRVGRILPESRTRDSLGCPDLWLVREATTRLLIGRYPAAKSPKSG